MLGLTVPPAQLSVCARGSLSSVLAIAGRLWHMPIACADCSAFWPALKFLLTINSVPADTTSHCSHQLCGCAAVHVPDARRHCLLSLPQASKGSACVDSSYAHLPVTACYGAPDPESKKGIGACKDKIVLKQVNYVHCWLSQVNMLGAVQGAAQGPQAPKPAHRPLQQLSQAGRLWSGSCLWPARASLHT